VRAGHTEAAIDCADWRNFIPQAVILEILKKKATRHLPE
jgi:3,4-dihydroxy-2-butanone 4-phosphate synthase